MIANNRKKLGMNEVEVIHSLILLEQLEAEAKKTHAENEKLARERDATQRLLQEATEREKQIVAQRQAMGTFFTVLHYFVFPSLLAEEKKKAANESGSKRPGKQKEEVAPRDTLGISIPLTYLTISVPPLGVHSLPPCPNVVFLLSSYQIY